MLNTPADRHNVTSACWEIAFQSKVNHLEVSLESPNRMKGRFGLSIGQLNLSQPKSSQPIEFSWNVEFTKIFSLFTRLYPIKRRSLYVPGQFFSSCFSFPGRVRLSPGASAGSVRLGSSLLLDVGVGGMVDKVNVEAFGCDLMLRIGYFGHL